MQTPPTEFSTYQNTLGGTFGAILHIDTGAADFYYSTFPITCTDAFIPDLLQPGWRIREGFNWQSKQWGVSAVTLNLLNVPYKKADGPDLWTTPADELGGIRFADATLYLLCSTLAAPSSSLATLLSKCLTRYVGVVVEAPKYDGDKLTLRLVDMLTVSDKRLPERIVSDEYASAPTATANRKLPLVYGIYTNPGDDGHSFSKDGLGLAIAERIVDPVVSQYGIPTTDSTFVISDHVLNALTAVFVDLGATHPALYRQADCTFTVDDSGLGTAICEIAELYLMANGLAGEAYSVVGYKPPDASQNVYDLDDTSKAECYNNVTTVRGVALWGVENEHLLSDLNYGRAIPRKIYAQCLSDIASGHTISGVENYIRLYYGTSGGIDQYDSASAAHDGTWQSTSPIPDIGRDDINQPWAIGIWARVSSGGAQDTDIILDVFEARVYAECYPKANDLGQAFAACEGFEYDTWITGRVDSDGAATSYAVGDCIEDPAGIVESILRDLLSLGSNIDETTFIDAENTSVQARINLHSDNEMLASKAIRQIAEQSTFAFVWTAGGKARLIPLNDASPTTARTIPWSHIKRGDIKVGKTTDIIDELQVKSRYLQEYGEFMDFDTVVDAGATGVIYEAEWPNIAGTSVDEVAAHLVAASTGIWSNEHILIEFETILYTNADLELGDWIELDDASVDPHIKAYGASWSGKQFLVYDLEQKEDSTKIKAIELH